MVEKVYFSLFLARFIRAFTELMIKPLQLNGIMAQQSAVIEKKSKHSNVLNNGTFKE